jgi:hypothetical protein
LKDQLRGQLRGSGKFEKRAVGNTALFLSLSLATEPYGDGAVLPFADETSGVEADPVNSGATTTQHARCCRHHSSNLIWPLSVKSARQIIAPGLTYNPVKHRFGWPYAPYENVFRIHRFVHLYDRKKGVPERHGDAIGCRENRYGAYL